MTAPSSSDARPPTRRIATFIALLTVVLAIALSGASDTTAPGRASGLGLPLLLVVLVAGEYLFVGFRYRGQVDTWNLMEAALAPLLFAYEPLAVAGVVAGAQICGAVLRRNSPLKATFNVVQWTLAAVSGSLLVGGLAGGGDAALGRELAAVVAGLALVAVVNQLCVATVLAIVNGDSSRRAARGLFASVLPAWGIGWSTNVVIGVLFVLAFDSHPAAAALFPLPLVALHLAQRSASRAAADRQRAEATHRALRVLVAEPDVDAPVVPFLAALAEAFGADVASLVELGPDSGSPLAHRSDAAGATPADVLEQAVLARGGDGRVVAGDPSELGPALRAAGRRSCAFSSVELGSSRFVVLLLDEEGFEGSLEADLALLRAVTLDVAGRITESRLVRAVIEERRKLGEIVDSTSDGILTIDGDGTLRSWNPAMERISGIPAEDAVGSSSALAMLDVRTLSGTPVDLAAWRTMPVLPTEIRLTARNGDIRRLSCSHSRPLDEATGTRTLVLVARDVSPSEEMETLRLQFGRLAEVEAAQRAVVDQLQQAVMPHTPSVEGLELGVRYISSDPSSPTGGDLYDCQVLPSGDVHLAVVDVLGHGVEATRHALMVMHTLRVLAVQGCPLEHLVERADGVLAAQDPELVATVMLGRYHPSTGVLRFAGGGHPSPLHSAAAGGVREVPAPGGAIGWPMAGSRAVVERTLAVGDSVVLYTDGVIEARKDFLAGTKHLLDTTARLGHLPADVLAQRLLDDALEGAERRDDSLLLVLRRTDDGATRHWETVPAPEHVGRLRREFSDWLRSCGCPEEGVDDATLVVSELLTNAVRAARQRVELDALLTSEGLQVAISDDGVGFDPAATRALVADSAERGRGLLIVHALAGRVHTETGASGSSVRVLVSSARRGCPAVA